MTGSLGQGVPATHGHGQRRWPRIRSSLRLRDLQVGLIALLLGLAAVGWLITDDRMQGMDMGPGTDLGALGFYVSAWVVMMAAMMFPSAAPMALVFGRVQRGRRELGTGARPVATGVFLGGYLLSWTAFGLAAYGLVELVRSLSIDALSWDRGGPYLAGGVIVASAVYQLTPLKDVCLSKCRDPLSFVLGYWRKGVGGALRMGVEHGAYCVGCCWALMATLFALGVMSVGWMVFVAALIATEKLLPCKALANRGIALLLLVLGLAVALAPERVPGLTLPDQARAMPQMGDTSTDHRLMDGTPEQAEPPPRREPPLPTQRHDRPPHVPWRAGYSGTGTSGSEGGSGNGSAVTPTPRPVPTLRGDAEVAMAELAFDDDQRHPLGRHLDGRATSPRHSRR